MTQYDIAVIGGGIHGAGVAQAAAAAGYSVVVVEKSEIASGTSSRSSSLVHGGLRYLESGQLNLVRKSLKERALLCRLAPGLVKLVPFYIPVYSTTTRRPWKIFIGLFLYALLGGLHKENRFGLLNINNFPGNKNDENKLDVSQLQVVFRYFDGQTRDSCLTRAVIKSAQDLGIDLHCHSEVTSIIKNDEYFEIKCKSDQEPGNHDVFSINASMIVNATGPWVNDLHQRVNADMDSLTVELVQGTHIVINEKPPQGIYYLETEDQRAVFVMPYDFQGERVTLVGTTETLYSSSPDKVIPLQQEIDYLLNIYNQHFPENTGADVIHSFAGLRVLPVDNGQSMFSRPRDTILHWAMPGLLTLYGGKLTAYRSTATKVLKQIKKHLGRRKLIAHTEQLYLGNK